MPNVALRRSVPFECEQSRCFIPQSLRTRDSSMKPPVQSSLTIVALLAGSASVQARTNRFLVHLFYHPVACVDFGFSRGDGANLWACGFAYTNQPVTYDLETKSLQLAANPGVCWSVSTTDNKLVLENCDASDPNQHVVFRRVGSSGGVQIAFASNPTMCAARGKLEQCDETGDMQVFLIEGVSVDELVSATAPQPPPQVIPAPPPALEDCNDVVLEGTTPSLRARASEW